MGGSMSGARESPNAQGQKTIQSSTETWVAPFSRSVSKFGDKPCIEHTKRGRNPTQRSAWKPSLSEWPSVQATSKAVRGLRS